MFEPKNENVDHINIYSKSKTELGRLLTNFAKTPFTYEPYGSFQSVEGFWYYYLTGCKHEKFKELYGFKAKQEGKLVREDRKDTNGLTEQDKEILLEAIRCKLRQNKYICRMLKESELPFAHYYWYGEEDNPKVYELNQYQWIVDEFERLRKLLKNK
jgi:hypothetical protein